MSTMILQRVHSNAWWSSGCSVGNQLHRRDYFRRPVLGCYARLPHHALGVLSITIPPGPRSNSRARDNRGIAARRGILFQSAAMEQ
jgi:hypothetical protein